jgi:hypothetical protein
MALNTSLCRAGSYGPGFEDDECFLTVQQLMHGTGLVGTFPFLRIGLPQYVMSEFDADQVLDLIETGVITSSVLVTTIVELLADRLGERPRGLGRLRRLLYGGATMSRTASRRQQASFPESSSRSTADSKVGGRWPSSTSRRTASLRWETRGRRAADNRCKGQS